MNSPRNTPSKILHRTVKSTPNSLRKQTPGHMSRHQFRYRRQNRLLRSELATRRLIFGHMAQSLLNRCSQMESTIAEMNAQLTEERDRTLQQIPVDNTVLELRNNFTSERARCEQLQYQLTVTRRENVQLRENVNGLARQLVYERQLREDHMKQHSVAVNNKTEILRSKLQEAFRENRLLKVKIEALEKVRTDLVKRHRTSLTCIKSTADELVSLIEKERTRNYPEVLVKKFGGNF